MEEEEKEMKRKGIPETPEIKIVKDINYQVYYINGVFGGINPNEGKVMFYVDSIDLAVVDPKKAKYFGEMKPDKLERRLLLEVRMSPSNFRTIADWMAKCVQFFSDICIKEKMGATEEQTPDARTCYVA